MSTIFQEKNKIAMAMRNKRAKIPGTKISLKNSQLLTSTGVPTLDNYLDGGLAIGTLILVEEDLSSTDSNVLLKHFLAEGVANGHSIFLASGDLSPEKALKDLPTVVTVDKKPDIPLTDEKLKIAWRYQNQRCSSAASASTKRRFDFRKTVGADDLIKCNVKSWNPEDHSCLLSEKQRIVEEPYLNLLQEIKEQITKGEFHTSKDAQQQNILRIGICSLGSPLWHLAEDCKDKEYNIPTFLYCLRGLLRFAYSVAMVTLPRILCQDARLLSRVRQMADATISLESFTGSAKSTDLMFKEFSGLLHVVKLPTINRFVYQQPPSDLAFKYWRKNLVVEKLHLPPDLSGPEDSSQRESQLLCCSSTGKSNPLDF